jgi:class 3 adenylate cyclase
MCRAHHRYFSEFYTIELYEEICRELNIPISFLLNEENWFSNEFLYAYIAKLKTKTGDPEIVEKIGLFTFTPEAMNPLEHYLLKSVPPFFGFLAISKTKDKLNRITNTKVESFRPGYFEFSTKPVGDEIPHPEVCDNTIGILKSVQNFHELRYVDVRHSECIHKNGERCRFQIQYDGASYWMRKLRESIIPLALIAGVIAAMFFFNETAKIKFTEHASSIAAFIVIMSSLTAVIFRRYRELLRYNTIYHRNSLSRYQELFQKNLKLDRRYNESVMLKNLCSTLIKVNSSQEVIRLCVDEMENRFGFGRVMVMLLSANQDSLFTKEARGFGKHTPQLYSLSFNYPGDPDTPLLFANILSAGKTAFIQDIIKYTAGLREENQKMIRSLGVTSLIAAPIQDEAQKFGLVIVGSAGRDQPLTTDDLHLIQNITNLLSLFFMNASNFQREQTLRTVFQKYVPKSVMDSLAAMDQERNSLAPRSAEITSVFIDLRGFTSLSEELQPEKVVEILNKYVDYIATTLSHEGGIIDNLMGDGIVAFFMTPAESQEQNHAEKAMQAALSILNEWPELNKWMQTKNYRKLGIGIGIHSGSAFVGNVGSDLRTNYTAIGDTINLASRLQDLTKKYLDPSDVENTSCIVFSKETQKKIRYDFPFTDLGMQRVRGREDAADVSIVTLKDIKRTWYAGKTG